MTGYDAVNLEDRVTLLRRVSFCAELPASAIADLAGIAAPLRRSAREFIQFEGDPAEAMYIIAQGHIKIARLAASGREQVLYVLGPGNHFNTVPIFDEGTCPANAQALTDTQLLVLPREPVRRVAERHPPLAMALLKEFSGRVRHLVDLVDELALHTVQGRLAGLLLAQAEATERGETALALTQAEMAAQLGTVREMVGRTLKTFESLGLIRLDRGQIRILDRAGLAAQCEE